MNSLLICVLACAFFAESSLALKCYTCNSINQLGCADLSNKSLQPEECVSSQTAAAIDKITGLIKDTFGNQPNIAPVFVCQKLVINNPNSPQNKTVVRNCSIQTAKTDVCVLARQASTGVDFCGVCEKDGCNGALSTTIISLPLLAIALIFVKIFA